LGTKRDIFLKFFKVSKKRGRGGEGGHMNLRSILVVLGASFEETTCRSKFLSKYAQKDSSKLESRRQDNC
jgi:hypothetical protein